MQPLNVEIPIVRAWAQVKKTREVVRWIFLAGNVSKFNVERRGRKSCLQLLDGAVDVEGARGEAAVHGVHRRGVVGAEQDLGACTFRLMEIGVGGGEHLAARGRGTALQKMAERVDDGERLGVDGLLHLVGVALEELAELRVSPALAVRSDVAGESVERAVAPSTRGGVGRHDPGGIGRREDLARNVGEQEISPLRERIDGRVPDDGGRVPHLSSLAVRKRPTSEMNRSSG